MILVSVRNHKALDLTPVLLQIADVRNHAVNAEHVLAREGNAAVNDNDRIVALKGRDVHADLLKAAERNNFDLRLRVKAYAAGARELGAL